MMTFLIFFTLPYIFTFVSWGSSFLGALNFRLGSQNPVSSCRGTISTCHNPALLIESAFEWLSLAICISNYNSVSNEFLHFGDSSKSGGPCRGAVGTCLNPALDRLIVEIY